MKLTIPVLGLIGVGVLAAATLGAQAPATTTAGAHTTNDGIFTEVQSKRGADLFQQQCAACHDSQLVGTGAAPALTGADFNANWKDETVASLAERIRTTMPGDNPGTLNRQQVADIVSFILNFNKAPAGQAELGTDPDAQKAIKIVPAN